MMVAAEATLLPHLGATAAAFAEQFGPLREEQRLSGGILHRHALGGDVLAAWFVADRAVAIRLPFATLPGRNGIGPMLLGAFESADAIDLPRVLVADSGLIVTTESCPDAGIRAVAASI